MHCFAPGTQVAKQAPLTQPQAHVSTVCQTLVGSRTSTVLPEHRVSPAVQRAGPASVRTSLPPLLPVEASAALSPPLSVPVEMPASTVSLSCTPAGPSLAAPPLPVTVPPVASLVDPMLASTGAPAISCASGCFTAPPHRSTKSPTPTSTAFLISAEPRCTAGFVSPMPRQWLPRTSTARKITPWSIDGGTRPKWRIPAPPCCRACRTRKQEERL